MKRPLLVSLCLALFCAAGRGAEETPARPLDADPRLDRRLTFPEGSPVEMATVFARLHAEAGVDLVAAAPELRKPLDVKKPDLTARELLLLLEDVLEGRWQREGGTYVLGPPDGLEEIAAAHPARWEDLEDREWRNVLNRLRPEEWKQLRTHAPIEYRDLRPALQQPVRQIALYYYWKDRQKGENRMLTLEMIRKEQYRLYLNDAHAFPGHEVISVAVYAQPGASEDRCHFSFHLLP